MAQQVIVPIMPNLGSQAEAMAGAQAVTFTATERQVIKERGGEVDKTRSFKELFSGKGLTDTVENEESGTLPDQDLNAVKGQLKAHRSMLKHAVLSTPRERVEIRNISPDEVVVTPAALAKDLQLNPAELFDKFSLEQHELYHLICRIKELHLKRLLSTSEIEFEKLSEVIKQETLAAGHHEAKAWLESQIENLKHSAAEYRQNLSKSLKAI